MPPSVECCYLLLVAARRYLVQGRVQGVGFRWFVEHHARALKLTGWVRNLDSGDVEVLVQGSGAALDRLHAQLKRGPVGSRVMGVDASEAPEGSFRDFTITD